MTNPLVVSDTQATMSKQDSIIEECLRDVLDPYEGRVVDDKVHGRTTGRKVNRIASDSKEAK